MSNRKGVVYLAIAILFVLIILTVFLTSVGESRKNESESYRILVINEFLDSLHSDMERAAYISAFRAFIGLEEYVSSEGSFLSDSSSAFADAFYSGSINGTVLPIMVDSSFSEYSSRLNQQVENLDVNLLFDVLEVNFFQSNPWAVNVNMTISVLLSDNKADVSWNYNKTVLVVVPISNLKDPLYSVNTYGKVQNFIVPTNISDIDDFIRFNGTDTFNFETHLNNSFYIASDAAPNFMMRFEGNTSSSPFGIESLIYLPLLQGQDDLDVYLNRSLIDHVYFGNKNYTYVCYKDDLPNWFKIDSDRVNDYDLDELNQTSC